MFYRNKEDITASLEDGSETIIDALSLWELKDDSLHLVDDDRFVTHPFISGLFDTAL